MLNSSLICTVADFQAVRLMIFMADKQADVVLLWEKNIVSWLMLFCSVLVISEPAAGI